MERIKYTEIKEYRIALLRVQNFTCPLCERLIEPGEDVLDHDHTTSHIRAVLHRNCNGVLGKIEYWSNRVKMTNRIVFLENVVKYLEQDYSNRALHPHAKKRIKKPTRKR